MLDTPGEGEQGTGQEAGARKNFPVLPAKPAPDPRNSPDAPTEAVKQL